MKVLHTSDWHLGQKFQTKDRLEEHQFALDWILELIKTEAIDALILAGDIFDIANPPNYARRMYYNFLRKLLMTSCRHVVIIGGNHDSPSMLEAPKALLESFQIHVIGAAPEQAEDAIIELFDDQAKLELLVVAVPFLRDRDIRTSMAGETGAQRIEMIKTGIKAHYQKMGQLVEEKAIIDVPIIATGHLYAMGAEASGKQDNIYIGDQENIRVDELPTIFDYVALGHVHRPQAIGGMENVRYSGSIIPLSFSETKDDKSVTILEWEGNKLQQIRCPHLPVFRRLKTMRGSLEEVKQAIVAFSEKHSHELTPWLELIIESDQLITNLNQELQEWVSNLPVEILKIRIRAYKNQLLLLAGLTSWFNS